MAYCTINEVQTILPNKVVIGTNLTERNVNIIQSDVEFFMEEAAGVINGYLSTIYQTPLRKIKTPDYENGTFSAADYPDPIPLINARLAAAKIYDEVISAGQEPNVSDWGKNQRSLAFDDLAQIQTGAILIRGQVYTGKRFVRMELHDMPRLPIEPAKQSNQRQAGQ